MSFFANKKQQSNYATGVHAVPSPKLMNAEILKKEIFSGELSYTAEILWSLVYEDRHEGDLENGVVFDGYIWWVERAPTGQVINVFFRPHHP